MPAQAQKAPHFAALLNRHREAIAATWAVMVHTIPDSHYGTYSLDEVQTWTAHGVTAISETFARGSYEATETYLLEVALARLQMGFDISEVIQGLWLFKDATLDVMRQQGEPEVAPEGAIVDLLDLYLRFLISRFGHLYAQAMTRDLHSGMICSEARLLTGAAGCLILLVEDGNWLRVIQGVGQPAPAAERLPLAGSLASLVIESGEPLIVHAAHDLARSHHAACDFESLLIVPLSTTEGNIGVLDVVDKPGGFTPEDVQVMSLLGAEVSIAIEAAHLPVQQHTQAEQLAVMKERQRLARELHDSVTQALYSVTLFAEATRLALEAGKHAVVAENLRELQRMAREAMIDMRVLIFELHPPVLEEEGLLAALQARLTAVETRAGLQTEIQIEGVERFPLWVEEELFWIALEALNNVVKHATARQVTVALYFDGHVVRLEIADDGIGFDPARARGSGGMGLPGIEGRARRINGQVEIHSAPGQGTRLRVTATI
jgi:signal transduction histidine kinase